MSIYLDIIRVNNESVVPEIRTPMSAIYDLFSAEEKVIEAYSRDFFSLGIYIQIPDSTYGQILPRNTMTSIGVELVPSLITSTNDDQVVKVLLVNTRDHEIPIFKGDRIAQLLLVKMEQPFIRTLTTHHTEEFLGNKIFTYQNS